MPQQNSKRSSIIGIGELLWDCFGDTKRPGGAPANVAFHAHQLGMKGVVVSRLGADPDGDALLNELAIRGISMRTIQRDNAHPTGRVTVDSTRADQPVYTIHEDVAWDHIEFEDNLMAATREASAICFGTLAQRSPVARATVHRVLDASPGALHVYDVNLRPPWYSRDVIEASLRKCHVVKLNDEEVPLVAELLEIREVDFDGFAVAVRKQFDINTVCITRGKEGCFVLSRGERVEIPGCQVDVLDTVGAGDAFTAAFVYGLVSRWQIEDITGFANRVGAMVAGHRGAMPDLRSEFIALRHGVTQKQQDS